MENNFSQIQFNIFLSMLKEYVAEKEDSLNQLEHGLQCVAHANSSDIPFELMNYAKQVVSSIEVYYRETKDFFDDLKMEEGYNFFHKSFTITEKTIKYLIEVLRDIINRVIDQPIRPTNPKKHKTVVTTTTNSEDKKEVDTFQIDKIITNREDLRRVTRVIGKELENIDYYLNMLSNQDFKTFADSKYEYEKLMHRRHSIENIKPSQAVKQITETASLIENAAENAEKLFHQSYLVNYLQFKTFFANTQESDALVSSFKKDMENSTKEKFIEAISRNADRIFNKQKDFQRLHQINSSTQTDDIKMKMHEKMQHLLMAQKRLNEKLTSQIQTLKKSQVNVSADKAEVQKKLEKEIEAKKQQQSKYSILQHLYNQKCYQLNKVNSQLQSSSVFKTQVPDKHHRASVGSQTTSNLNNTSTNSVIIQTDVDFYYYYENTHIEDLHKQIYELEKIVNHKDYVIKEMEAVRTFRDNFKSKKQIVSAVMLPKRNLPEAKSLRYLKQDEEQENVSICHPREETIMNSLEAASTRKLVTFREVQDEDLQKSGKKGLLMKKKSKIERKEGKHQTFFAFNDKINNPNQYDEFISDKGSCDNLHQISLKSILKIGYTSGNFKINSGTQTDLKPDPIIENTSIPTPEKGKERVKSKDKHTSLQNLQKSHRIRPSFASTVKSSKGDRTSQIDDIRKSNFINEKITLTKVEKIDYNFPSLNRNSQSLSPMIKKEKIKMMRTTRFNQHRIKTTNNQVLHNKTLNLNFNFQDQSKSKPKMEKENRKVNQKHLENKILRMKR